MFVTTLAGRHFVSESSNGYNFVKCRFQPTFEEGKIVDMTVLPILDTDLFHLRFVRTGDKEGDMGTFEMFNKNSRKSTLISGRELDAAVDALPEAIYYAMDFSGVRFGEKNKPIFHKVVAINPQEKKEVLLEVTEHPQYPGSFVFIKTKIDGLFQE